MTRIVGGVARGRRLSVPVGGTRPTSERAREALFNSLRSMLDIDGAAVLDLFAGSAAVGLEALSRGAASATLVDNDRAAGNVIRRNVAAVGLPGAVVRLRPVAAFLSRPPDAADGAPWDLVFADPPYALADSAVADILGALLEPGLLSEGAVVVVERAARGAAPTWPTGLTPVAGRRYGEGTLWYGRRL